MSYQHIENLYKSREIMLFRECYALEKIHGTSAHISWNNGKLNYFAGGSKHENFVALFCENTLAAKFTEMGHPNVIVFGEAYGGKCQGMSKTYGTDQKFVAFEVQIGDLWLDVPNAANVAATLGIDFVPYKLIPTTIEALNAERDADSAQAAKSGMGLGHKREGIVLRPPIEVTKNNGERVIAKYKREDFAEVKTPRSLDGDKFEVLQQAQAIADEWVTEMRLGHVLDTFPQPHDITQTGKVIAVMVEDVLREAEGEIVDSREARAAIGKRTALMFKARLKANFIENA